MKIVKKAFAILFGISLITSCINDNVESPSFVTDSESSNEFYISLEISPVATRTTTENEDSEIGQDYENEIESAIVIFAARDNEDDPEIETKYVTHATFLPDDNKESGTYIADAKEVRQTLIKSIGEAESKKFDIYVIANPTSDIVSTISQLKYKSGDDIKIRALNISWDKTDEKAYGWFKKDEKSHNFVMTNGALNDDHCAQIIKLDDLTSTDHSDQEKAYSLGTISVQRLVARFDFDTKKTTFTQQIADADAEIEITGLYLFNMNDQFSMFKQVGRGTERMPWIFFDNEKNSTNNWNFVYDPNATTKASGKYAGFHYTLATKDAFFINKNKMDKAYTIGNISFTAISDISGKTNTKDPSNSSSSVWENYKAWRYVMPNSVYSDDELKATTYTDLKSQLHKNTTGVIFKAEIVKANGKVLSNVYSASSDKLYFFDDQLYGNPNELKDKMEEYAENGDVVEKWMAGIYQSAVVTDDRIDDAVLVKNGFTIYEPTVEEGTNHYYCYYYYWNCHNDNNNPKVNGPMEFAVVSNNVYKLSIEEITKFGHPADPANDPDPVDPDNPNETEEISTYFSVSCEVLPWIVRLNKIKF